MNMEKQIKKNIYVAPVVDIMTARVEHGFEISNRQPQTESTQELTQHQWN